MNYNRCVFVGRLAADPVFTPSTGEGENKTSARLNFRLMINRIKSEKSDVINCVSWGKMAEAGAAHLSKGKETLVEGSWRTNSTKNADGTWNNYQALNVEHQSFGRDSLKKQQADGKAPKGTADIIDALAAKLAAEAKPAPSPLSKLVAALMKKGLSKEQATQLAQEHVAELAAPAASAEVPPEETAGADSADVPF